MGRRLFTRVMVLVMLLFTLMPTTGLSAAQKITPSLSAKSFELGKSVTISYKLSRKGSATITIKDSKSRVAAKFRHSSVAKNKKRTVTWKGTATTDNAMGLKKGANVPVGKYTVEFASAGTTRKLSLTVKAKTVRVKSVSLSSEKLSLQVDKKATLTKKISPTDATNQEVTWKSSDKNIATVSQKGVVTGVKAGKVTITVTTKDGNKTDQCAVTVKAASAATAKPTVKPTAKPTVKPTAKPTVKPTAKPTVKPTAKPTVKPTVLPSMQPTVLPSMQPTVLPSMQPTILPSMQPTFMPTMQPTIMPTMQPTSIPMIKSMKTSNGSYR